MTCSVFFRHSDVTHYGPASRLHKDGKLAARFFKFQVLICGYNDAGG
jgi:hypothetical protein